MVSDIKKIEKQVNQLLLKIGLEIEAEAKRRCPVDTGRLRASIVSKSTPEGIIVGSPVEYSLYVEYGTFNRDGSVKMYPQPFLFPAVKYIAQKYPNIRF